MRITDEDKIARRDRIIQTLTKSDGLTENELSTTLHIGRRTINNHLRWLQQAGKVRKDGLIWYATKSRSVQIIEDIIVLLNQLRKELN